MVLQHFFLNGLAKKINQLFKPFIMSGDFNSHNVKWGSHNTVNRYKEIEKNLIK
jgi:endonuclease/exonuclease/phosphatase (EEP) superfamily protein YafD